MKEKDKHGSKEYDKILKENFEAYFLPFIEEVLELKIVSTERLPDNKYLGVNNSCFEFAVLRLILPVFFLT